MHIRHYIGAIIVLTLVISLAVFLALWPVPAANAKILETIVLVITGSAGYAISTLIGKDPNELKELKAENVKLHAENAELRKGMADLNIRFSNLQQMIITELVMLKHPGVSSPPQ